MKYNKWHNVKVFFSVMLFSFIIALNVCAQQPVINVYRYGADNTGKKDVSAIFQAAINNLSTHGGGELLVPAGLYLIKYTIFLPSNIKIYGTGKKSIIKANISVGEGRCAFLIGDSHETNYEVIKNFRSRNIRGWPTNSNYKDISIPDGLSLQSGDERIKTRNSSVENLLIVFDYTNCKNNWGGYALQFSNSADCYAKNIWTVNACQAIGIGSDTAPATPACVNVFCYNIHVIKPDPVHTYYAIGFISNSNNCGIINADSYTACTPGSPDGSLIATNFVKNCIIKNIKGVVGKSKVAEGILLNNAYGCKVSDVEISNANSGISISFTDFNQLLKFKNLDNSFNNITINQSENGLSLLSKFTTFNNITLSNCKKVLAYNINATNNSFLGFSKYLNTLSDSDKKWIIEHNLIKD